jgi:hypothetical protein
MRIVISIFTLPHEIDDLETLLTQLRRASKHLSGKHEWVLDVSMCIANDMVDWKRSALPKSYFIDKLLKLSAHTDWCAKYFTASEDIKGCVSHRKHTLETQETADYYIWLDTDIIFDEKTLSYMEETLIAINDVYPYTIITPEIVRVGDSAWDCLVNEKYLTKPLGYHLMNNPYIDCGVKGEVTLEIVNNGIDNQPRYKFNGGWFTCLSGQLLRRIGIPETFSHYGFEDVFLMWAAEKLMVTTDVEIHQFKIKNLVICENYKYRNNSHILNHLSAFDKRDEFKKISEENFNQELQDLI